MSSPFIHPTAIVDSGAKLASGVKIWHHTHVCSTASVGKNSKFGQNCYIAGVVGKYCKIQNNVNIYQGVSLQDYVFCGPSMTFTNDLNPRAGFPKNQQYISTQVQDHVSIGAHATIVCGLTLAYASFIGAGAVVTKNTTAFGLYYGNPARHRGWMCVCGEPMPLKFSQHQCQQCQRTFSQVKNQVTLINNRKK